ncbi:MAG: ArsR/SmtB family transcription factor [Pelagimonas sp.]|uniref:ArsR/SmtB family transcription factor n=1 Tax=Pelagimonas sp. TaxID=2073170 RepID=UPI003D6A79E4
MEKNRAIASLASLAHETRIEIFRLLIKAGSQGVTAGEIATKLDVRPNTLSNNLNTLTSAGLVRSQREGRSIRYFAQMEAMKDLLTFLLEDCCGGQPDLCQPMLDKIGCR